MNKKIILTMGILFLLAIAGCKVGNIIGGKNGNNKNQITDANIRKGTIGLEMEFLKNAPPEKVFAESVIPISLKLKNSGASNIDNGIVVFGLEKAFVNVSEGNERRGGINIEGKSTGNPNGDYEIIQANAQAKKIGPQSETHTSTIFATACYPYKTIFGASVCIDTDITGEMRGQKACAVKDITSSEGQGAPVAVTKVEVRMLPQTDDTIKPSFMINIENVGKGEVINPGTYQDENGLEQRIINKVCNSPALNYKDFNILEVSVSLSGTPLNCKKTEEDTLPVEIRLKEKKGTFRCTLDEAISIDKGTYAAPLMVQLDYGYTDTISKDIIIQKILTY